ncbi:hypothetical protein SAMN05421776_11763 [Nocardia farcinica]|uniref:Capsid maturation protease n=1 Tax=Nocardia farcinica TaxID=37329 RepID=A0A0H5PBA2_NOCFR|nr:hypothetical protein [Nocardia farcinica]PFW99071.1 hypothetical protein CJ469_05671 [Nocardia farcinica]PFX06109.1 hypothetical protein CJ468_04969 [Nocardia farcinica]CRY79881.1 Uncharacterised protein [Nocardia farcinica]SIT33664.1 hypothetical protein SAMN05421776_11763 [Nocardia farcinica]
MPPTVIDPSLIEGYRAGLSDLSATMIQDLDQMLGAAAELDSAGGARYVRDAYPEVWTPYGAAAGELSSAFYAATAPPGTPPSGLYVPPAELPSAAALSGQAEWALARPAVLAALVGVAQRDMWGVARQTITNSERGTAWARHASANACRFCQVLATRGAVYGSKKNATGESLIGGDSDKYHKNCHCVAVPVHPGSTYEPPDYVAQWKEEYETAATNAGSRNMKSIMAEYRRMDSQ